MRVIYDSNVLVRYFAGDNKAKVLIERVIRGEWDGYITDVVVSEVVYIYLRLTLGVSRYKLKDALITMRESVKELLRDDVEPLLSLFKITRASVSASELLEFIENYGLLPNDALIAIAAIKGGMDAIATFDDDFKRVHVIKTIP